MNLVDLASFVHVVELGTLRAAADAEGVPTSTISRRVARLEDALGVALLRRAARSVTLTDDGRLLHARAAEAVRELEGLGQALTEVGGEPRGRLVITAPQDVGSTRTMALLLASYRERWPGVVLEVRLDNRVVDLVAEGVDVALRAHTAEVPGGGTLMTRALRGVLGALYASPAYLEAHPGPERPEDLADHALVVHSSLVEAGIVLDDGRRRVRVACDGAVARVDHFGLGRALVQVGVGIALLPALVAEHPDDDDGLVRVLPGWKAAGARLSLVWPASRHLAPRVRAFLDLATEVFGVGDGR